MERQQAEERLAHLNECLLSFGPDPMTNIERLVALSGTESKTSWALYNRLQDGALHT